MKWKPIDSAPKDGAYILVGNRYGAWIAAYEPIATSGYRFDNPWRSMMLNHRHMKKRDRPWSSVPTHWMPLPHIPLEGNTEP